MPGSFLRKKSSLLKKRPLVVGTLTAHGSLQTQIRAAKTSNLDLLEVRLDDFHFLSRNISTSLQKSKELLALIKKSTHLPILLTLRSYKEAGKSVSSSRKFNDAWRWALLKELLPSANVVDIEANSGLLAKKVSTLARRTRTDVIFSHHNFKKHPSMAQLTALHKRALHGKADILKVAVMPKNDTELRSFLKWGLNIKSPAVVLIAMGPQGILSRFLGYSFGSIFTYGHLGQIAAPGQIHARDLSKSIRAIYR